MFIQICSCSDRRRSTVDTIDGSQHQHQITITDRLAHHNNNTTGRHAQPPPPTISARAHDKHGKGATALPHRYQRRPHRACVRHAPPPGGMKNRKEQGTKKRRIQIASPSSSFPRVWRVKRQIPSSRRPRMHRTGITYIHAVSQTRRQSPAYATHDDMMMPTTAAVPCAGISILRVNLQRTGSSIRPGRSSSSPCRRRVVNSCTR